MQIGPYKLRNPLVLAPMAGVTDRPFRQLCKKLGAGMAVSEMVSANSALWGSKQTLRRMDHSGEVEPRIVQIAGADPQLMADAARFNVERGAQIIDINMGCPAKKVCNVLAGSALLKNEALVADIVSAVVNAVDVPVTLKIRTGWDRQNKNAVRIAGIAEHNGVQALTIHGRTRADAYHGEAEYETIAEVKSAVSIPVIANGDITDPEKAKFVLEYSKADGLMIGRAARGNPWIFKQIKHYLAEGALPAPPQSKEICRVLTGHLHDMYQFYGELSGVRIARKHIGWYIINQYDAESFRKRINNVNNAGSQLALVAKFFKSQKQLAA